MTFLGLTLLAVARILRLLINIYTFVIAIAVLLSWVNPDPSNPIVRLLRGLTEPVFRLVRRALPPFFYRTRIDWTPLLVLLLLIVIDTVLLGLLFEAATALLATPPAP